MIPALLIAGTIEITSANLYTGDKFVPFRWNEIDTATVCSSSGDARISVVADSVTFEYYGAILAGIENRISIPIFFSGDSGRCRLTVSLSNGDSTMLEKVFIPVAALYLCSNLQHKHEDGGRIIGSSEPQFINTFESFSQSEFENPGLRVLQDVGYLPLFSGNLRRIINETLAPSNDNVPRAATFLLVLSLIGIVCIAFSIDRKRAALALVPVCFLGLIAPLAIQRREDARVVEDISLLESGGGAVGMHFMSVIAKPGKQVCLKRDHAVKPVVTRDSELAAIDLKYSFGGQTLMTFKSPDSGRCAFAGVSFLAPEIDSGDPTDVGGVIPRFFGELHLEQSRGIEDSEMKDGVHFKRLKFKYRQGVKR